MKRTPPATNMPQTAGPATGVTTSYGGENIVGFRVVRTISRAALPAGKKKVPGTLAAANKWLLENAVAVEAHAKASTKRLIGRDGV